MFSFIPTDSAGFPQKRKQTSRACELCRKRKKRCDHLNEGGRPQAGATQQSRANGQPRHAVSSPQQLSARQTPGQGISPSTFHTSSTPVSNEAREEANFVGDLNPEAIFLATTSPQTTTASGENGNDSVGIWSTRRAIDIIRANLSGFPQQDSQTSSIYRPNLVMSKLLHPYLQEQCLRVLPHPNNYQELARIYIDEVHPIFPILDLEAFHLLQDDTPSKIVLQQTICLAASTNLRAKPYLILETGEEPNHKIFAENISSAIRTSLDLGVLTDKLTLIQVLGLLSLFTQLSDNQHLSAELHGRAVSLLHTTGLHLQTQISRKDHEYVTRLFLCVWALDRLNASFHGRPVLMHERDFGHDLEACFKKQEGCFQLFLRIILLLDKVIDLYRPKNNKARPEDEINFPPFEELVNTSGALRVNSHLLATVETLYHAVAMLSGRSQSSQDSMQSSTASLRQNLSAARVISIVGEEFHGQLSLLPLVPYALSLSLRVSYRDLRLSKAPIFRTRARKKLLANCSLLRELGEIFWSAMFIVELAEHTIRELDKVLMSQQLEGGIVGAVEVSLNGKDAIGFQNMATTRETSPSPNEADLDETENAPQVSRPLLSNYDPNTFDPSAFDAMPEFDIFQFFGADFGLDAVDATLGDNINLSFPTNIVDYGG